MTCKQALRQFPKLAGESNNKWFKRLSEITGLHKNSLNRYFYTKRKFVETQRKLDKNGNVTSRTEKLQQSNLVEVPEDLELSRLSTNVTTGQQWAIYTKESQKKALFKLNKEIIEETLSGLNLAPIPPIKAPQTTNKSLVLTFADTHVGMNIENDLYHSGKWNKAELDKTLVMMTGKVYDLFDGHNQIIVEDLGDLVDHWNKQTTRGGHYLPTNMDNVETFQAAANFKIQLAINLSALGVKIKFYNVVNDNHGGDFSHIVNLYAQNALKHILPKCEYHIFDQFINHYINEKTAVILTHGKDKEFAKFGFDVKLNDKAKSHINSYIDIHKLHDYRVQFKKGDSHQQLFDFTQPKFDYLNYMALSPASEWVSTNFAKGRRGFTIETLEDNVSQFTTFEL
jgi:hypothetical protein